MYPDCKTTHKSTVNVINSGVATGGVKGGRVQPLTAKNMPKVEKKREKSGKIEKKEEESGRKGKNLEGFFHFAPPDRQGWLRY